jgi:hypothetical protein
MSITQKRLVIQPCLRSSFPHFPARSGKKFGEKPGNFRALTYIIGTEDKMKALVVIILIIVGISAVVRSIMNIAKLRILWNRGAAYNSTFLTTD